MKNILITIIGTGMYLKEANTYRITNYLFSDGKQFKTSLFAEALVKSKSYKIDEIYIIGTKTSSWGALITNPTSDDDALRLKILEETEDKKNISDETLLELTTRVQKDFEVPVHLKVHTDAIDEFSINDIFQKYIEVSRQIEDDAFVLFDITHGFRSMSLLIYQALQYSIVSGQERKIALVYGEYDQKSKISYVRDLSQYWVLNKQTTSLHLFKSRFDGYGLSELLEQEWPKAAKWFKSFTEMVQGNFSLQIDEKYRALVNVLEEANSKTKSFWLQDVYAELQSLERYFSNCKQRSDNILRFAEILAEKKMYTQAIIALQVSVETRCLELCNKIPGDYDAWKEEGKKKRSAILQRENNKDAREKLKDAILRLGNTRNQIAHGGAKNPEGGFPNAENHHNQFTQGLKNVKKFFELAND